MFMWEIISGITPFNNIVYNNQLVLSICKGKRPNINDNIPQCYERLMKKCWDINSLKRPTALEIKNIIENWYKNILTKDFDKKFINEIIEFYKEDNIIKLKSNILPVSRIINNELISNVHTNDYLLIMQYANDGDLQIYLERKFHSLTWINKKKLAFQIAEGLIYLHNENILHRDLVNDIDDPVVLSIAIAKGAREATIINTPKEYEILYQQCWDSEPEKRPTVKVILEKIKKMIIEDLLQTYLDANPERNPTIIELFEVSKTMGLPFEDLYQRHFESCPEKVEINVNSISENNKSISEMQTVELNKISDSDLYLENHADGSNQIRNINESEWELLKGESNYHSCIKPTWKV
ncbi:10717_t:CDS:2 [Funneliformis geosporum]|uniref:10717_t:CDS:1 n=1 Tax=Funneliformis geosporum TaxID=1117311 RepID=A0A9W4SPK5_9GLOM|nr:10717_t:CDS:2 [Funneliformis geosporum]